MAPRVADDITLVATLSKSDKLLFSNAELCTVFGVTRQTIAKYVRDGMPKEGRGEYYAPDCIQWVVQRLKGAADVSGEARERLYVAQERKTSLEADEKAKLVIPVAEAHHVLTTMAGLFVSQLVGLSPRVAGLVADIDDPAEIEELLDAEVTALRESLSKQLREFERNYQRALRDCDAAAQANSGRMGGRKPGATTRKPRTRSVAH